MDSPTALDKFENILRDCCAELLGQVLAPARADDPDRRDVVCFIDLRGVSMRATVVAHARVAVLRASHPRRDALPDKDVLDWAGELLNQIAGRVANRLSARGVDVQIGIPGAILARDLDLFCAPGGFDRVLTVFETPDVRVNVSVDAIALDDTPGAPSDSESGAAEGDLLLF